jgi:hypothetical protein
MSTTTDIALREEVNFGDRYHMLYPISYNDMVQSWLELMHADENMVIIYDPVKHIPYLQKRGFDLPTNEMWESKLLMIEVSDIDDAMQIIKSIDANEGPYCQAWIQRRYITDNIDK